MYLLVLILYETQYIIQFIYNLELLQDFPQFLKVLEENRKNTKLALSFELLSQLRKLHFLNRRHC